MGNSTTLVSSRRPKKSLGTHTTVGDITVSRPGPASISTTAARHRGDAVTTVSRGRLGVITRSTGSVQSKRMRSSQLIREGRLEEAMHEVNTMLIVVNSDNHNHQLSEVNS